MKKNSQKYDEIQNTIISGDIDHKIVNFNTISPFKFYNIPNKDIFYKTKEADKFLGFLQHSKIWGCRIVCLERKNSKVKVLTETKDSRWVIDCASNDYLQMNARPDVKKAVIDSVNKYGIGSQGASMLNGNTPIHKELESTLAQYLNKESVALSPSGYSSQLAATQGLLRNKDSVFFDQLCHQSLLDGIKLSGANMFMYSHLQYTTLKDLLENNRKNFQGALIVTDSVFSAIGNIADFEKIICLAKKYDAKILVDDAHGLGVIKEGLGCSFFQELDLISGTLSKAFGSAGGFIAGKKEVINYLRFFGNANCSTTNISIPNAAAALKALQIIQKEKDLIPSLQNKIRYLRNGLIDKGINVVRTESSIVTLHCGSNINSYKAWRHFFDAGILVHALGFPTVPRGKACIRLRINIALIKEDLDHIIVSSEKIFNWVKN